SPWKSFTPSRGTLGFVRIDPGALSLEAFRASGVGR
ncbi:MAG: hypothetical protein ACI9C2_000967, partial [Gammaproteobacteria bacterium]